MYTWNTQMSCHWSIQHI